MNKDMLLYAAQIIEGTVGALEDCEQGKLGGIGDDEVREL
jgi:hypothetical protein